MTTKFYHDTRSAKCGAVAPVKISICHQGRTLYLPTNISVLPSQWDAKAGKVVAHPQKAQLNSLLTRKKLDIDTKIYQLQSQGSLHRLDISAIKAKLIDSMTSAPRVRFMTYFDEFAESKNTEGTRGVYRGTTRLIRLYCKHAESLTFEDITRDWVLRFDKHLETQGLSRNYINIHLRNIRAVMNAANDDELTTTYPFRKITIRPEESKSRAMTAEQLRLLCRSAKTPWQKECVDIFMLIFCLCGINMVDLCHLPKEAKIDYVRTKTGQHCAFSIPEEAKEIIERYKGQRYLINALDRYKDYKNYLHRINDGLKSIGKEYHEGLKCTGQSLFPYLSTYYARYTWASIAAELDVPKETIAAALAHASTTVTDIYIRTDYRKKIDKANRQVLDYVFHNKK